MNESRNELVIRHLNLVYSVLHKNFPKHAYDEDLVQIGRLALVEAADRWDESKSEFGTFAWTVVTNAIRLEFRRRNKDWRVVSLNNYVNPGDDSEVLTYEDTLRGDDDVNYCDHDGYYSLLTDKERELADLLRSGLSVPEIARLWNCSRETVYTHRRRMILKWRKLIE